MVLHFFSSCIFTVLCFSISLVGIEACTLSWTSIIQYIELIRPLDFLILIFSSKLNMKHEKYCTYCKSYIYVRRPELYLTSPISASSLLQSYCSSYLLTDCCTVPVLCVSKYWTLQCLLPHKKPKQQQISTSTKKPKKLT